MTKDRIFEDLLGVFQQVFGAKVAAISPETSGKDIKGWDLFNHLNLILAVEKKFGVMFSPDELEKMQHVGDIAAMVEQKLRTAA